MRLRAALTVLAAAAAFLGAYAVGEASQEPDRTDEPASVPAGDEAPAARPVPVPAAARLPELRDATSDPAPRHAPAPVRRAAPAPARPAPAPRPAPTPRPQPEPDTGTPFFDAE